MALGDKIRRARLKKKWTARYVVNTLRCKISATYLNKIELHGEIPRPQVLKDLSKLLGLPYYLLVIDVKKEKTQQLHKVINKRYEQEE